MAPPIPQASAQLRQMIYHHLDNSSLENALFLAERLHALETRNPDAVHLLALCHYRLGQYKSAHHTVRIIAARGAHLGCTYVFAQSCLKLEEWNEGLITLEKAKAIWGEKTLLVRSSDPRHRFLPDAATCYCLLGKLLEGNQDIKRAVTCYVESLKLNPMMWDAFQRLSDLGTHLKPANIFKTNTDMIAFLTNSLENHHLDDVATTTVSSQPQQPHSAFFLTSPSNDPFQVSKPSSDIGLNLGNSNLLSRLNIGPAVDAPSSPPPSRDEQEVLIKSSTLEPPNAPIRSKSGSLASTANTHSSTSNSLYSTSNSLHIPPSRIRPRPAQEDSGDSNSEMKRTNTLPMPHKRTISGTFSASNSNTDASTAPTQRRSVRLFRQKDKVPTASAVAGPTAGRDAIELKKAKATGTRGRTANVSTVGRVVSGNRKAMEPSEANLREHRPLNNIHESTQSYGPRKVSNETARNQEAVQYLMDILSKLGQGYYFLCQFKCADALQQFLTLPVPQRETAWVLAQIGKAHFEQSNYAEAEKTFARIKKIAPTRLEDMELYSTALWHLKNDTELAFLSHELIEADRASPQAWCTIGNSFSLQREHDQALKCFKRATQLDPKFAYGFTLQGHEHVSNEEYDKAMVAYRRAINADRRHYNGWYGLAKVYEKQGKFQEAEVHYRGAAAINPNNAILECCIGMALEKLRHLQPALDQYTHACNINPQSAVARFRKARVLVNLRRPRDALEEFLVLKDMVPDESNVHFMLGKVYKMLHDKPNAIRHYTVAMNLDPKAEPYIKEAMECLDDSEDDEMEDEDDDDVMG